MKQLVLMLMLLETILLSAQTTKTIKPKPVKATVYLSGAELSYLESLSLPSGTTEIILEGVSAGLDENSISAYFKGGMVIDTRKAYRYPEMPKNPSLENKYAKIILRISDSLDDLYFLTKDCTNKQAMYETEKNLLLNNRLIRGEFSKDSIGLLRGALDLLRQRLQNIDEEQLALERKLLKFNKLTDALNNRKNYLELLQTEGTPMIDPNMYQPIYQLIVTVETEQAVTGNLSVKYYIASAGWIPMYDIIATSGKDKIQLVYRAQVYQNTGIDWKDVALTLSTSNPSIGNTKPMLSDWNIFFGYAGGYIDGLQKPASPQAYYYNNNVQMKSKKLTITEDVKSIDDVNGDLEKAVPIEPIFNINDNFLRTEYEIKTKYSIVSDNKAHNVVINNTEVIVGLAYLTAPKLDKDAFLMGKVANWEDLNLMPGAAKIYFDESYIGTTTIDPVSTKDTLYVNLGRDRSIMVKRLNVKEKCKETVIGDLKIISKTVEITVRNTKSIALDFEIEDQIPITKDNNIKITLLDNDDAIFNPVSGKLIWKKNIKPKDTYKVRFSYEIKYPKDKFIQGL
ncbi:MAG: DUF4139 domain-containing protein [Bacteroidota bacterium]